MIFRSLALVACLWVISVTSTSAQSARVCFYRGDPPDIVGDYTGFFGVKFLIGRHFMVNQNDVIYHYCQVGKPIFTNSIGSILTQNDAGNALFPHHFNRLFWVRNNGEVFICHTVVNEETMKDALAQKVPDASDPRNKGCGARNVSWMKLTPR